MVSCGPEQRILTDAYSCRRNETVEVRIDRTNKKDAPAGPVSKTVEIPTNQQGTQTENKYCNIKQDKRKPQATNSRHHAPLQE
jgi:hypothetical protein